MFVRDLKEMLKKAKDDDLVVLAGDEEGNDFHTLYTCSLMSYSEEEQAIGVRKLTKKAIADGYTEDDVLENGVPCIVLWP